MQEMIRLMMEINKKIDDNNKELKEHNQKNIRTLKEELSKKIEDTNKSTKEDNQKNMETLSGKIDSIIEDNKQLRERLNNDRNQSKEQMKADFRQINETLDNTSKCIKEASNKNMEPVNKKIENKEDIRALLSGTKDNRNKENVRRMELKTKKMRQMHQQKLINTWEELEMIKNGLGNVLNLPMTNHKGIIHVKKSRRNLIKLFKGTHNQTVGEDLKESMFEFKTPEGGIHNKTSMIALMMDIPLTYLFNKLNGKGINVVMDANEHVVLEELLYKVAETYITRTEIVLHTRVI